MKNLFNFLIMLLLLLLQKTFNSTATTLKAIEAPAVCTANLLETNACIQIGNKYYLVEGHAKLNWFQAAHLCRRLRGQLATIETESELTALSDYLITKNFDMGDQRFWLALNDLGAEGNFYSIGTGNVAPYTKWSPWQPDNFLFNEHCVHLLMHNGTFHMNDFDCRGKFFYICELYYDGKPIFDIRFSQNNV